jgi:hypothetical protein
LWGHRIRHSPSPQRHRQNTTIDDRLADICNRLGTTKRNQRSAIVRQPRIFLFLVCLIHLSLLGPVRADVLLVDPHIPPGEHIVYRLKRGDEVQTVRQTVTIQVKQGRQLYAISSHSKNQEITVELDKRTMHLVSSHTVRRLPGALITTQVTVADDQPMGKAGEIALADVTALPYVLRGFPFTKRDKVKIRAVRGASGRGVILTVKNQGKEKVTLADGAIDCYKLTVSLDGFWARFLPTTQMWYSVTPPHYLVRYEGPDGPPGAPKRLLEVVEYAQQGAQGN